LLCAKCTSIRFQTPRIGNSLLDLVSIHPTLSPSFSSKATSSANFSSLSTSALIGVIVGVIMISGMLIAWVVMFYYYGKGKLNENVNERDEKLVVELKSNMREEDSFNMMGTNDMMKKRQNKVREYDSTSDANMNFSSTLDETIRAKLRLQGKNFDSDLKRKHFPLVKFESALLSFNDAHATRPSELVFDDVNPMFQDDYLVTHVPRKVNTTSTSSRPVSVGLMNRYTAAFDYLDTFLHLKADQDLESDISNPIGPNTLMKANKDSSSLSYGEEALEKNVVAVDHADILGI